MRGDAGGSIDERNGYLGWTEASWKRKPNGPWWHVRYHFAMKEGRAVCVGIDLRGFQERTKDGMPMPIPDRVHPVLGQRGHGLESVPLSLVREIPFGALMNQAAGSHRRVLEAREMELSDEARASLAAFRRYRKRQRRPMYDDAHFRTVAEIYSKDATGNPTLAVANRFHTSRSAAAKWVSRARDKGFLPPARGQGAH